MVSGFLFPPRVSFPYFCYDPNFDCLAQLILKGVITGFILSLLIGPVFFLLLETSIRKGVRAALAFDLGVFLSDLFYIAIATFFYAQVTVLTTGDNKDMVNLFGGIIFIVFGITTILRKPHVANLEEDVVAFQRRDYLRLGLKGFFLNFINPAVIFYWIGVISIGVEKKETDTAGLSDHIYIYIAVLLATFFAVDILKILGAKRLRPVINDRVLTGLNRLTGLIILGTGIWWMISGIIHLM